MTTMLLLALTVGAPLEPRNDPKAELAKSQGVWKATEVESRGAQLAVNRLAASDLYTLAVAGDAYALGRHAGTMSFDPGKKTVDFTITEGRYKGMTLPGIYELTGDTLKIALCLPTAPAERPKEMKTDANSTFQIYSFAREKATKEQAEAKLKELKESVVTNQPFGGAPGGARGGRGVPATDRATQELLRQVIDRLDRIEKRLDEMEKKEKK